MKRSLLLSSDNGPSFSIATSRPTDLPLQSFYFLNPQSHLKNPYVIFLVNFYWPLSSLTHSKDLLFY